jgi:hypothetical protein
VAAGKRKRPSHNITSLASASVDKEIEVVLEEGLTNEAMDPEVREMVNDEGADTGEVDEAKAAHDDAVVRGVKADAIKFAKETLGIEMTAKEEKTALGLFPKVCLYTVFHCMHF